MGQNYKQLSTKHDIENMSHLEPNSKMTCTPEWIGVIATLVVSVVYHSVICDQLKKDVNTTHILYTQIYIQISTFLHLWPKRHFFMFFYVLLLYTMYMFNINSL